MGQHAQNSWDETVDQPTKENKLAEHKGDHIIFHAKPSKKIKDPTHTLCFMSKDDKLLCTYSRPHPGLESYSKADGRFYAGQRMQCLKEELNEAILSSPDVSNSIMCTRILPNKVRKTIGYYAGCAKRYFKLADNPLVIIRGQYADWQTWMANGRSSRVPLKSVIVSAHLNQL